MNIRDAEEKYANDPLFRSYVHVLMRGMEELHLSPGEMRQIAIFAEVKFMQERNLRGLRIVGVDQIRVQAVEDAR